MTSEPVYVWAWLPGAQQPVPAGRLDPGEVVTFTYGRSYLAHPQALPLGPELPLRQGRIVPAAGLTIAGCIADAAPDAWGQRVILHRLQGHSDALDEMGAVGILTYLMESGSNRIGALDFQASATQFIPRLPDPASLEDLTSAAERLASGEPIPPALEQALLHGSSVGGARPKATFRSPDTGVELIAKFSLSTDPYPVVNAEAAAMLMARRVGVDTASVQVTRVLGRDVLLVERFDRTPQHGRRMVLSLLTLLELDEMVARYASYHQFADVIRLHGIDPAATLRQLFRRVVVNVAVSNTDDHARNHAVFWDGRQFSLTPAYDLCPQLRAGGYAELAMPIGRDGAKAATFATCVAAADVFLLARSDAAAIVDEVIDGIHVGWMDVVDQARLTVDQAATMWQRQILNPAAFAGWPSSFSA